MVAKVKVEESGQDVIAEMLTRMTYSEIKNYYTKLAVEIAVKVSESPSGECLNRNIRDFKLAQKQYKLMTAHRIERLKNDILRLELEMELI